MESTDLEHFSRPRLPRAIAGLILGAIALASLASLAWPALRGWIDPAFTGPTAVGVVRRVIDDPRAAPIIGQPAPDFEWNAASGQTETLATYRGKTVILNFWATWCVPCREEMPALERAAAADPSVVILALDLMEDGARARGFFDSLRLTHLQPVLDLDGAVARRYVALTLPTTFFIGPDGTVRAVQIGGPMTPELIADRIARSR